MDSENLQQAMVSGSVGGARGLGLRSQTLQWLSTVRVGAGHLLKSHCPRVHLSRSGITVFDKGQGIQRAAP